MSFARSLRQVAAVVVLAGMAAAVTSRRVDPGTDRYESLARVLRGRGLELQGADVAWLDRPRGPLGGRARAVVRAAPAKGDPHDIFLVETRLSPEGVLLSVGDVYNLTETSSADEQRPVLRGAYAVYVAKSLVTDGSPTVHILNFDGAAASMTHDWTRLERAQNSVTNYQQTGQLEGVEKLTLGVEPEESAPAEAGKSEGAGVPSVDKPPPSKPLPAEVTVDIDGGTLVVRSGSRTALLPLARIQAPQTQFPKWLRPGSTELSRPGSLVTWAVDRVRAEVGDNVMQTVKAVAFTGLDFLERHKEGVTGDTGAKEIAHDLGTNELDPPTRTLPVDTEIGWPPTPLEPWVTPALGGEGTWHPLDRDPFVRTNEGLPPAFVTTFIRSDRTRKATRVYIALWDPRQVELHMMAGTVEPKGATGEAGPGLIPRTPEVMKRVVAASNAGFQALHGEFGMMADGVVYLPPKPYAATVAALRDGTTGFGTWPENVAIPEQILSYRQNMTVMVQDEKFNPYNRTWWGGTPPGWADKTHTVRTGICLTKEHFIGYFYGAEISPDALAQAMIQARCAFGLALDMNAGHSGLEFYKVAPAAELEPMTRPLQFDWEHEGGVPGIDGWKFRARRLIRGMGLMQFPRYIKREARDFFYMTLRHILPGAGLVKVVQKPDLEGEGQWKVRGLPQHGFPYALALTEFRPDASRPEFKVRVLQVDPRTVAADAASSRAKGKTVAIVDAGPAPASAEGLSLWHSQGAFSIAATPPVPDAVRLFSGDPQGGGAAGIGVSDEGGMMFYVEVLTPPGPNEGPGGAARDAHAIEDLLKKLNCSSRLPVARVLPIALGGDTDLAGSAVRAPSGPGAVRLTRVEAAGGRRIFEDTKIVPFDVWYPLQQKRIRYFKKPQQEEAPAADENN